MSTPSSNLARLADDHKLAKRLAREIADLPGVAGVVEPQTNLLYVDLARDTYAPLARRLAERHGVAVSPGYGVKGAGGIRIVTHLGVGDVEADKLVAALRTELTH